MKQSVIAPVKSMYYGWWIVIAAFLCIVFIFGVPTTILPVVYSPLADEFGWSREQLTLIATMKFISGAVWGFFFASYASRINVRWVIVGSGILTGLCMIAFLWINALHHFYIVGFLLGVGSLGVMISVKVLVSSWFTKRQGFAVGIALMGTSVAGTFAPYLASKLFGVIGWRETVAWMSAGIWLVALPVFLWKAKESPHDVGAEAHDEQLPRGFHPNGDVKSVVDAMPSNFGAVLRTPAFWFLAAGVSMIGFVDQAWNQHYVLYFEKDVGLSLKGVSGMFALGFFVSILGKVGFGWLYDKLSVRGVMICYVLMAISVVMAVPVEGIYMLMLFSVVRGVAHGGSIVDIPVLAKHCHGPKVLGRTIGLLTAFVTVGFAIGPPVVGRLRDTQGNYMAAFFLLTAVSIGAALCLLGVKPTYWESIRAAKAAQKVKPAEAARTAPALQD